MHFGSYRSFERESEKLRYIWERPYKVVGIGIMCRIMECNHFTDDVYMYIRKNMQDKRVHVYGMPLSQIRKYGKCIPNLSTDSTKWTKRVHKNPPLDKSICCTSETRPLFFYEYMKWIRRFNKELVW